jgi:hypothetical protein
MGMIAVTVEGGRSDEELTSGEERGYGEVGLLTTTYWGTGPHVRLLVSLGEVNYICSTSVTTVRLMGSTPSTHFILISFICHYLL